MRFSFDISKFLLAGTALHSVFQPVSAVLYGDEQFGSQAGGNFWAFHSAGVSVVDPNACKVIRSFTSDNEGTSLPTSWYDGVYMEGTMEEEGQEEPKKKGMIFMNSGVTRSDGHENPDGGTGEVYVFSADPKDSAQPVLAKVGVGPRPVHSYGVYTHNEFWTHSDGDGHFYVINLDDITKHSGAPVVAKVDDANHGKLQWDEGDALSAKGNGFATSTGESILFIMDLEKEQTVGTYNYTKDVEAGTCRGTHAIAYSAKNNHIYVECTGGGGIVEYDVADPLNPVFVHQHLDATGALYETPDQSYVVAANKGGNFLHVFEPQGSGVVSSREYDIVVPGHPSTPTFYPKDDSFIACMPLTENTNRNHMDENGNLVCDYYGCSGASTPQDVANGICNYDAATGSRRLLQASLSSIDDVRNGAAPFGNACARCAEESNYDDPVGADEEKKCTCTPFCGSCAEQDYDASKSGVVCVNLGAVTSGQLPVDSAAKLIEGAGSVRQGSPYSYSPQCGFGRTYRTHKRGDKWDASVAHFPTNSLQLVNFETLRLDCAVDLPGVPSRVVYVPPQMSDEESSEDGLSSSARLGIVVALVLVVLGGFALLLFKCRRGSGQEKMTAHTQDFDAKEEAPSADHDFEA